MAIMQDPIMQSILQQAQGDPAALQEHMKNAVIKSKIQVGRTLTSFFWSLRTALIPNRNLWLPE